MINMLTIIITVYNKEKYLRRCLDSVCSQTFENLDIILVDDGSEDGGGLICDEYANNDNRIRVIHQRNMGMLRARYNGLLECNSQYVTFVDADDWIDLNAYEPFRQYMIDGVDVIIFGKIREKENGEKIFPISNFKYKKYGKKEIIDEIYPSLIWDFEKRNIGMTQSLCDKIIKRDFLVRSYELTKYMGKINFGEDSLILYPLMQWIDSLMITKDCPYHYRQIPNEVPSYISDDNFYDKLYIWYKYLMKNVNIIPHATKQIEYLYVYFSESRKQYYKDVTASEEFIFPFNRVPFGCKIVLWGGGSVGRAYYEQIRRINYCYVVAWVDKAYKSYPESIIESTDKVSNELDFDYIIIALLSQVAENDIYRELERRNVAKEKIIWQIQ